MIHLSFSPCSRASLYSIKNFCPNFYHFKFPICEFLNFNWSVLFKIHPSILQLHLMFEVLICIDVQLKPNVTLSSCWGQQREFLNVKWRVACPQLTWSWLSPHSHTDAPVLERGTRVGGQ